MRSVIAYKTKREYPNDPSTKEFITNKEYNKVFTELIEKIS